MSADFQNCIVAYWPLDYDGSDSCGNGLHLGAVNMTVGGEGGPSNEPMATFNGINAYFTVPDLTGYLVGHKATINLWIKSTLNVNVAGKTALMYFSNLGNSTYYSSDAATLYESFGALVRKLVTGVTINREFLHMYTVTVNEAANEYKVYHNGVLIYQTTCGTWDFVSSGATLGRSAGAPNYHDGKMAHVGIWSKDLSAADVLLLYNQGFGTLYAYDLLNPYTPYNTIQNKLKRKSMFNFTEQQIKSIVHEAYGKTPILISAHSFTQGSTTALVTENLKYAFFGKVVCSTVAVANAYIVKLEKTGGTNNGVNYNAKIPALYQPDMNGVLDIENQLFNKWSIDGSACACNFYFIGFKVQFD